MQDFNFPGIPETLTNALTRLRFEKPTPVQAQTIPHALEGRDVLATAQTGTGKTAAFGIPLITRIMQDSHTNALVLLPTRELAAQVFKAFQGFLGKAHVQMALLVGGEPYPRQEQQLKAKPRIIIGTPGRINDHLDRGNLILKKTGMLVLDEVDRMLDMGFSVQLDAIAKFLPAKRQTLMFSATLPGAIKNMSAKYLDNPAHVTVGEVSKPALNLKQSRIKVTEEEKYDRLLEELEARQGSIIVFVKTKRSADNMMTRLKKQGHKTDALHGDLRQNRRNRVVAEFRKQKSRVLVATDVAARGLDIPHVAHVINYNLPQCPEDYIHRIGRTARAGASGEALNFLSPREANLWRQIECMLDPSLKTKEPQKPSFANRRRRGASAKPGNKTDSTRPFKSGNKRKSNSKDATKRGPFRADKGGKTFGKPGMKPKARKAKPAHARAG